MSERLGFDLAPLLDQLAEMIARRVVELQKVGEHESALERSPWLSIEKAALHLDWPKQRLYRLTASGQIPHYKHEGRLLFHRGELDEWMRTFAQPGPTGSDARSELFVGRA